MYFSNIGVNTHLTDTYGSRDGEDVEQTTGKGTLAST